ncbi:MAG: thioredoxin domain-containing protein [Deltaproteobacteria bacterium]|nr:thioredoxin domain-containing protein [Deltaproteobacteria bacterium]
MERKPNRLLQEQSPYLRQHAYNPVDWYPWGQEALARAKAEDKPILLSIGYSACHWCHVMERESFENEAIARLMNENFVSVKVDREERPDLDQIYMDAVQVLTGRGGWPLTVFLTPDGKPFYGGTYFPPEDRHGIAGFPRVLTAIADAYHNQPTDVQQNVERLTEAIAALADYKPQPGEMRADLALAGARALAQSYDRTHGGIGGAPKFPNMFVFSLFLRMYAEENEQTFGDMVHQTLLKMAKGGIYDQLGGGFHRYSVDERWLVPHFEKMLYDNALLARLYLEAGCALKQPEFFRIARETLDYALREMTSPEGGFYSSQDADSEGEEGRFFLWTPNEVRTVLDEELAPLTARFFDVSDDGNFEGRNILHRTIELAEAARMFKRPPEEISTSIETARELLFYARERRIKPGRDEKILAAWNGMMISAFAEGYRVLGDERFLQAAARAADFVKTRLWDGRALRRSFKDGLARFNGYLEDYSLIVSALVDIYEASLDRRYLKFAQELAEVMIERFADRENGGFFFTSDDHENLITRGKAAFDGSTPSGNSAAVMALLRLHSYLGNQRYLAEAEKTLRLFAPFMEKQPFAFSHMLEAADFFQRGPTEIVIIAELGTTLMSEWLKRLGLRYVPNRAIFAVDPNGTGDTFLPEAAAGKKQIAGRITAYVCRERVCSPPITSLEELEATLDARVDRINKPRATAS